MLHHLALHLRIHRLHLRQRALHLSSHWVVHRRPSLHILLLLLHHHLAHHGLLVHCHLLLLHVHLVTSPVVLPSHRRGIHEAHHVGVPVLHHGHLSLFELLPSTSPLVPLLLRLHRPLVFHRIIRVVSSALLETLPLLMRHFFRRSLLG